MKTFLAVALTVTSYSLLTPRTHTEYSDVASPLIQTITKPSKTAVSPVQRVTACGCPRESVLRRDDLSNCLHQYKLNISNCRTPLTRIDRHAFANTTAKIVYLANNNLVDIPSDFFCSTLMTRVYFRNNPRFTIRLSQKFSCTDRITFIDLVGTNFQYEGKKVFDSFSSLRYIDASGQNGCEEMMTDLAPRTHVGCLDTNARSNNLKSMELESTKSPTSDTFDLSSTQSRIPNSNVSHKELDRNPSDSVIKVDTTTNSRKATPGVTSNREYTTLQNNIKVSHDIITPKTGDLEDHYTASPEIHHESSDPDGSTTTVPSFESTENPVKGNSDNKTMNGITIFIFATFVVIMVVIILYILLKKT